MNPAIVIVVVTLVALAGAYYYGIYTTAPTIEDTETPIEKPC